MDSVARRGGGLRRPTRRLGRGRVDAGLGPTGLVASYCSYEDAREAVGRLARRRFPVQRLAIAAADARTVERVDGRATGGLFPATGTGAVAGAGVGLALGVVGWVEPAVPLLWAVVVGFVVGALAGLLAGLVTSLFEPDHRTGTAVSVQAERFDLLSDQALAAMAARLLAEEGER